MTVGQAKFELKIKGFPNPGSKPSFSEAANRGTSQESNRGHATEEGATTTHKRDDNERVTTPMDTGENSANNRKERRENIKTTHYTVPTENKFQNIEEENLSDSNDITNDEDTITFEDIALESSPKESRKVTRKRDGKNLTPPHRNKKQNTSSSEMERITIEASIHQVEGSYFSSSSQSKGGTQNSQRKEMSKEKYDPEMPTSPSDDEETTQNHWSEIHDSLEEMPNSATMDDPRAESTASTTDTLPSLTRYQERNKHTKDKDKTEIEEKHEEKCGCHACFEEYIGTKDVSSHSKLIKYIETFIETRSKSEKHINPPTLCKCSTHLSIKRNEHTWHNQIWKDVTSRLGQQNPKSKENTSPQNRQQNSQNPKQ